MAAEGVGGGVARVVVFMAIVVRCWVLAAAIFMGHLQFFLGTVGMGKPVGYGVEVGDGFGRLMDPLR